MENNAGIHIGQELELDVRDLSAEGGAVARKDGLVFFLDHAVPGARVLARVTGLKKRLVTAEFIRDIFPSPSAAMPFCEYFGRCGGCSSQDLDYPSQLHFKRQRAAQTLARLGGVNLPLPDVIPSPALVSFRNKMEYAFGHSGKTPESFSLGTGAEGELVLGLRKRNSREVLGIDRCPLQTPGVGLVLLAVRDWARGHALSVFDGRKGCLRHLVLREPLYEPVPGGRQRMVELICGAALPAPGAVSELAAGLSALGVTSFMLSQRNSGYGLAKGERVIRRFGQRTLWERYGDLLLEFPPQGFMQTNTFAAASLCELVEKAADPRGGETVLDLYCGSGMFGLGLARRSAKVTGVEFDREAVKFARANAGRLGLGNASFVCADAAVFLKKAARDAGFTAPDVLLIDPPRSGLGNGMAEAVKRLALKRLVYVSCNPGTLARDLAALSPEYNVCGAWIVDMFPHSPHMEIVARLEPAS